MNKNDIVRLEISALTNEGNGVGRYEGIPVFVPYTAVGDVIDCKILKCQKNLCYGKIENIIEKGASRIEPDCPSFYKCGGCAFRHISYEAELSAKQQFVHDCFKRIGGFELSPEPILPSPDEKNYRNKAQLPVSELQGGIGYGFFSQRSHRVVPFDRCEIQPEEFCRIADCVIDFCKKNNVKAYDEESDSGILRHIYLRKGYHSGELMLTLVLRRKTDVFKSLVLELKDKFSDLKTVILNINPKKTNVILGDEEIILFGDGKIKDTMCENLIEISSKSFYQINTPAAEGVYRLAKEYAGLSGSETLLDLYCGAGTVGLSMADSVKKLIGVEIIPEAIENAKVNAKNNDVENAEFICGDAGKIANMLAQRGERPDVIVIDPPRKGADENTLDAIIDMAPEKVVYISCNPATAARDSKYLCENGYELIRFRPADMFPRTVHTESVILLQRKSLDEKFSSFFENARLLNSLFSITPLMYGSMGLEYITGAGIEPSDIDILIPKAFLFERWEEFKELLNSNGYVLIDEHEHTFEKNGVYYSYAQIEELETFAGINESDIKTFKKHSATFKLLTLEQYLKVYTASSKDGYRVNVRNKKDQEKIELIKAYLKRG